MDSSKSITNTISICGIEWYGVERHFQFRTGWPAVLPQRRSLRSWPKSVGWLVEAVDAAGDSERDSAGEVSRWFTLLCTLHFVPNVWIIGIIG